MKATVVLSGLLLVGVAEQNAAIPSVSLKIEGETRQHTYRFSPAVGGGTSVNRIVIAVRGDRPARVLAPEGWKSVVRKARSSTPWGCSWEAEWTREVAGSFAQLPISGFGLLFEKVVPASWCWCEIDTNTLEHSFAGPGARSPGVE